MLSRIAIFSKDNKTRTKEGVARLVNEFAARGVKIQVYYNPLKGKPADENYAAAIEHFTDLGSLAEKPQMVFSVGGDGTFLETVMRVKDFGIPIAGVNTGRMGFLANIPEEEIGASIDMLCQGRFGIIERALLEVSHPEAIFENESASALNEVTIQKTDPSMITIHVYVDGSYLNTYWADGLIISTATGSTAYNLSAGGPILSPEDESIIISSISPHNLTIRPIIISGESRLKMIVEGRSAEYLVTCDFRSKRLSFCEEVHIQKSENKLKTVMLHGRDFYSTLRSKLMWGADRRN
jgi:NAD+ kinase